MAAHDGNAGMAACHHDVGDFHRFGKHQSAMRVDRAAARFAACHEFFKVAGFVVEKLDQGPVDQRPLPCLCRYLALEKLDDLVAPCGARTDYKRREEAVDEHPFPVDPAKIGTVEIGGETRFECSAGILIHPYPDEMRPDRQPFVMQVAEHPVQLGVPVVQVAHIGRLEGAASKLEGQHDVAGVERHHLLIHMARVGQKLFRRRFALRYLERHGVVRGEQPSQGGQSLSGANLKAGEESSCFRPRTPGCGCQLSSGPRGTAGGTH